MHINVPRAGSWVWRQNVLEMGLYLLLLDVCTQSGILTFLHYYNVKKFSRWKVLSEYLWFSYCSTVTAQYCSVLLQFFFCKLIDDLLWNNSTSLLKQGYFFNVQALLDFWVWSSSWNLECFCWIFLFFFSIFLMSELLLSSDCM